MTPADAQIIREPISRDTLRELARARFGDMVKAVVDVTRATIAAGGELHSDEKALLLDRGPTRSQRMTTSAPIHADAARRWHAMTLMEQLAHVGSEVDRAIRAHESGKRSRFDSALTRALELFDLTATDVRWKRGRRREILRAREEFCRLFYDDDVPPNAATGLRRYFLAFAVAARTEAGRP